MKITKLILILYLYSLTKQALQKKSTIEDIIKNLKVLEKEEKETKNEIEQQKNLERKLFFPYMNPMFINQPIAHTQRTIHNEKKKETTQHNITHSNNALAGNPYMQPPISPFLSLAHMNPFLIQGNFFGMNPFFSQFLRMQYASMLPFYNPYYGNGQGRGEIEEDPDTADMRERELKLREVMMNNTI